jgi:hypothetical protein
MRDVLVSTSSYEELQLIHVARRLWVGGRDYEDDASDLDREKRQVPFRPPFSTSAASSPSLVASLMTRQDLDRRFAYGIHLLLRYGL